MDRPLPQFHMRVYLLVTSICPLRAYVHSDLTVLFATLPFSLEPCMLGENFEKCVHLTNQDINARPSNYANYAKDKPGVGQGSVWDAKHLESWLRANEPSISVEAMWRQIRLIGRACTHAIAAHPTVVRSHRHLPLAQTVGFELFGLDVMLDDSGKCWLLECNDSPGLEPVGSHFPKGTVVPDAQEGDATTRLILNDTFALLGYDRAVCTDGNPSNYLRVC
jgi:tubulin polyglutamylase TTLL4